jgi:thiol-disulfide isomerase/thioredoxin
LIDRLRSTRIPARLAAVAAVVALTATACGAASDDEASSATSAPAPAESTRSATPSPTEVAPSAPAPVPAGKSAAYISYADYLADQAAYDAGGDVVLFFAASWCPTCQRADRNLTASGVPSGLTVVKIDYDASTALKKQYGVTVQHTFVQVDPSGKALAKFTGSDTAEEISGQTV